MSYCFEKGIPHSEWLSWSPEDRAKTIAYRLEDAERCAMCGTADWEWEADKFAYEPVEKLCHGCYLKDQVQDDLRGHNAGTSVVLLPTKSRQAAQRVVAQKKAYERARLGGDDD